MSKESPRRSITRSQLQQMGGEHKRSCGSVRSEHYLKLLGADVRAVAGRDLVDHMEQILLLASSAPLPIPSFHLPPLPSAFRLHSVAEAVVLRAETREPRVEGSRGRRRWCCVTARTSTGRRPDSAPRAVKSPVVPTRWCTTPRGR